MKLITFVDGSNYSPSVCDHAAWIAEKTGASIELVHVLGHLDTPGETDNLSGSIGLGARTELLEELAELDVQKARLSQKRGRAILEDAKLRLHDAGIDEVTVKLRHGEIVEAVEDFEGFADLIVIGKRGEAADLNKLHLGSNLERVVRSSSKPVLVASRAFNPISQALVAFDGGNSVMEAIEYMVDHPVFSGIKCDLLAVNGESSAVTEKLNEAVKRLIDAGYTVTSRVESGHPESVISAAVEGNGYDLLIMGAYGHSRIRNMIIGSTTTEMVRSCLVPVLMFR